MFDIKWIRENPDIFDAGLAKRGLDPQSQDVLALDAKRREHVAKLQDAQNRRNAASKEIGAAKAQGDEAKAQALMAEVAELKTFVQSGEDQERKNDEALKSLLSGIPNMPLDDVPQGTDEDDNILHAPHGEKPVLSFEPKQHFELGEALGLMDFETAAKMSGARFVVLTGALARLERALAQFMLNLHTDENGYVEVNPPLLVHDETMYGTAQLPKFADDQFTASRTKSRDELLHEALKHATEEDKELFRQNEISLGELVDRSLLVAPAREDLWLIPTAEVPLTNLVREQILDQADLPLRFTAHTPCFRAEAGAAGKDTRGMIRQHQFSKVELVSITTPDKSLKELERLRDCAEEVLKQLGLHYRVMVLSTGDMGFAARKTYDLEVWLPGQDMFREISSCSVCGDFQARRMNTRFRVQGEKQTQFVHTLNGSGLAVGRTLVAVLENYQNEDGSITIPEVLRPYMGGLEKISAE